MTTYILILVFKSILLPMKKLLDIKSFKYLVDYMLSKKVAMIIQNPNQDWWTRPWTRSDFKPPVSMLKLYFPAFLNVLSSPYCLVHIDLIL